MRRQPLGCPALHANTAAFPAFDDRTTLSDKVTIVSIVIAEFQTVD
jgi:hypothetical protein